MVSLVDSVLNHMGKPGFFHVLVTILLCCNFFPIAFHHLVMIFYGASIPHNCRLPEGWPWHKKFSIPKVSVNGPARYDQCHMFVDPNSAKLGTKPCVYGWEFYPQGREWTIVAEWGLVCEREYLISLASVVYHGGVLFGGIVCGTLADKFGRKPLMLFALYVQTAIAIGFYFVQNFIVFVILRFVHGFLLQGLYCTTISLVMELLPLRYRTAAGMGCSIVWSLAMVALSLVSYSVQHWRYIQLSISLPCVVTFLYIWLIPESMRWLVTIQKSENAVATAQKFAQFNKKNLDENFCKDVEMASKYIACSSAHPSESYGLRELLQGPKMRTCSLVLCFSWFSAASLYHSVSLLLLESASNRYVSVAIIGVVDLVALVVMYFLLVRFGRKRPICALLVLGGAICISTVIAENLERSGDSVEMYVVSTVLALIERSCAAACLAGLTICAAELFPTVIRAFGIGVCLFFGQIGWVMAPEVMKLGQVTFKSLPWIVLGALAIISGFLVILLPESLTKPLPDTLDDMEHVDSRKKSVQRRESGGSNASDGGSSDEQTAANDDFTVAALAEDTPPTPADKKWYNRNYSRKSATVVRFYGLDGQHEDPCQEVKTSKKQRIRMVRFSFESEEFRLDPRSPMGVRRISVIKEEPELENGVEEEETDVDKEMIEEVSKKSRFVVRRILDPVEEEHPGERKSRFIVKRVEEDSLAFNNNNDDKFTVMPNCAVECAAMNTKFSAEAAAATAAATVKVSRFLVSAVKEEAADSEVSTNS